MQTDMLNWLDSQQSTMESMLHEWCSINTGTENVEGLNTLRPLIIDAFKALNAQVEVLEPALVEEVTNQGQVRQVPVGHNLRISKIREGKPKVMMIGHMDTVFDKDHEFQMLTHLDEDRLQGPGVTDMKGGILVMLHALKAFEQSELANELSWEVFLNSDEETGSRGSMPEIIASAKQSDIGLGYEPCMPHGALAGQRKGSANYAVSVKGRAAHAGREFHKGRNAVAALCRFLNMLDDLNDVRNTITLNVAQIQGGGALNVVPPQAVGRFNIRVESLEDQQWFEDYIEQAINISNQQDGLSFEPFGGFTRPPKIIDEKTQRLCDLVQSCGQELGIDITYEPTGGCCDGNNLVAAGLPTVDTLGVRGANIHSSDEFIWIKSLSERAKLSYLILRAFAQNPSLIVKA